MPVRFAIDEASFKLDGLDADAARFVILTLLDQLDRAEDAGHGVCYDEDFFAIEMRNGEAFWSILQGGSDLVFDQDDIERATAFFGTMHRWYDLPEPQPTSVDVSVDGGNVETSGSIAWVHAQAERGLLACACLAAPHIRSTGEKPVTVEGTTRAIWFIETAKEMQCYFRSLLRQHATSPDHFAELSEHAFLGLSFVNDCFDGIKRMSKDCRLLSASIVNHLAAFSDEGAAIFSGSWKDAPARFGSLGVSVSDENGNTKSDKEKRADRLREFEGEQLYFWWHSKLEPDRDRIHICPDHIASGGRLIVGIFCRHLK